MPKPGQYGFDAARHQLEAFYQERREVMLSMDAAKIMAFHQKHNPKGSSAPIAWEIDEVFWMGVHKARCAMTDLPARERQLSAMWLTAHNSRPLMPLVLPSGAQRVSPKEFEEWRATLAHP